MKKFILVFAVAAGMLASCRTLYDVDGQASAAVYELRLLGEGGAYARGFVPSRHNNEIVYRTHSLEDALAWQESLQAQGVVTDLQKKGGTGL